MSQSATTQGQAYTCIGSSCLTPLVQQDHQIHRSMISLRIKYYNLPERTSSEGNKMFNVWFIWIKYKDGWWVDKKIYSSMTIVNYKISLRSKRRDDHHIVEKYLYKSTVKDKTSKIQQRCNLNSPFNVGENVAELQKYADRRNWVDRNV